MADPVYPIVLLINLYYFHKDRAQFYSEVAMCPAYKMTHTKSKTQPIAIVGGLNLSLRVRDSLFERGRILIGGPFVQKLKRRF